jgi:hypothetical protein
VRGLLCIWPLEGYRQIQPGATNGTKVTAVARREALLRHENSLALRLGYCRPSAHIPQSYPARRAHSPANMGGFFNSVRQQTLSPGGEQPDPATAPPAQPGVQMASARTCICEYAHSTAPPRHILTRSTAIILRNMAWWRWRISDPVK